jgi:hypothetical protein
MPDTRAKYSSSWQYLLAMERLLTQKITQTELRIASAISARQSSPARMPPLSIQTVNRPD